MFLINNKIIAYCMSAAFLLLAVLLGISKGSLSIPFSTIILIIAQALFPALSFDMDPMLVNIVMEIRLPRVILALFVGAALAMAGAAFQGFLKNPLADPYTLGVSSGAAVGAVCVIFFGITLPVLGSFTLPLVSISASFVTLLFVIFFARMVERSFSTETIILVGIITSAFLGSFLSLMIALTGEELRQIIGWLLGSVSMRGWNYVKLIVPLFCLGALLLLLNARELNALAFGEETARHLGVNTEVRKMVILLGASLLTGAAVAVSGMIGFVGLVIPHLIRIMSGADHRHLLPLSMIIGAGFLILTDLLARTIIAPTELPIGVITALVGGPVFGILLLQQRRK